MKRETLTKHITPPAAKPLLAAGLIESGTLEGFLSIWANTEDQLLERIKLLRYDFDFYNINSPDVYLNKQIFTIYVKGFHKSIQSLKETISELESIGWFVAQNSTLNINSTDVYCNGKWCI
jgi:hypothetical protein